MLKNIKSSLYINKFCQMLISKGKKALTQNSFKKLLFFYAKKGNKKSTFLFKKCFYNLFPYVALKIIKHKRGKRISYKTKFIKETKAEKKALLSFSKFMKESSNKPMRFVIRLGQEFQSLANNKKHSLRFKRDNLHKIALKNAKKPWTDKDKNTKSTKNLKFNFAFKIKKKNKWKKSYNKSFLKFKKN